MKKYKKQYGENLSASRTSSSGSTFPLTNKKNILWGIGLFLFTTLQWACKTPLNYLSPNKPIWKNNEFAIAPSNTDEIKVVSFNIEFSKEIEQAIQELQQQENLANAHIILLQEMDEMGTQQIAAALNYNYLYFSFSFNDDRQQNFGNAILSKFPLQNEQKVILPHVKLTNKRKRMVTLATVNIKGKNVLLCSVHLDTILLGRRKRLDQSKYLIAIINEYKKVHQIDYAIVGGDFNTIFKNYRKKIIDHYQSIDFDWMTAEVGATGSEVNGWLKPINDHIFADGFELIDAGKYMETKASDHYPIWVNMAIK